MERTSLYRWIGIILIIMGTVLVLTYKIIFNLILDKETSLSPTSNAYEVWRKPQIPVTTDVYLFNCTNPEQLLEKNYKPNLVELGPYRFKEYIEKVDITWNDNHTVTYRQIRRWYFDPENSNGTMEDDVTMLNVVPVTASFVSREWSNYLVYPISTALKFMVKTVWINKPASQLIMDGYTEPLISIVKSVPGLRAIELPDKVGFFYGRNGSAEADGVFNMDTGESQSADMGTLYSWNYENRSSFYEAECGQIRGYAGMLYPPRRTKESGLEVFAPDICRTVKMDYAEDTVVHGIQGYRYTLGKRVLDNGTTDPDTWCNCGDTCYRQGILNVSACRHGAPAFMSFPHFLDADPYYRNQVTGMTPDPEKHRFHITLEPRTGVPLDVAARIQLNMMLQPNPRITMFKDVPTVLFPVIWFEHRVTLPPELAAQLEVLLKLPSLALHSAFGMIVLGIVFLCLSLVSRFVTKMQRIEHERKPSSNGFPLIVCETVESAEKFDESQLPALPMKAAE